MRVDEQEENDEDFLICYLSKESLMTMIIKWSLTKDSDQVIKEIKNVSKSIEHFRRLNSEETL